MTVLETPRLILRDMEPGDLDDLHALLSDADNMYYLDDIRTSTLEETALNLDAAMRNADGHYFCIRLKDGAYVGQVGYTVTADTPLGTIVHMGWFMMPHMTGNGYMTEAVKRALRFAFEQDGCVRVTTACYKDNARSERVMIRAGFRKEGERLRAQYHDGRMKDRLEYALNSEECTSS